MKVIHLELPRSFTFTIKEYLAEEHCALEEAGHEFLQIDLNPLFWKWLLTLPTAHGQGDFLEPLLQADQPEDFVLAVEGICRQLENVSQLYEEHVDWTGLFLGKEICDSSYAMSLVISDSWNSGLCSDFFDHVFSTIDVGSYDLVSLGCDYQEGVFWALRCGAWLKGNWGHQHICIGRHAYENYSLVHHVDALRDSPWFFFLIDSIVLYGEELAQTFCQLSAWLSGRRQAMPDNIALNTEDGLEVRQPSPDADRAPRSARPAVSIPADYFHQCGVPLEHLVYATPMVRNRCFYHRCTFCVQINKHLTDVAYQPADEIERSLESCRHLARIGVRMINFMDEAMRPVDVKRFSEMLIEEGIKLRWVGRMIAASRMDEQTLASMKESGCTEILFGMESFDPEVLQAMGKIQARNSDSAEVMDTIQAYLDADLFLILSMIYDFPVETEESRRRTRERLDEILKGHPKVAVICNRFLLFHTSVMEKNPGDFGIRRLEPVSAANDLQYVCDYVRSENVSPVSEDEEEDYRRLELGLSEPRFDSLIRTTAPEVLHGLYHLDYGSFGFKHRVEHRQMLLTRIFDSFCPESAQP